jgi:flagellar basal-body rod modification protein FlgD
MATIGAVSSGTGVDLNANGIGLQDFLKILLTQLTYQDPLKPMDNQQFMAQIAQFTTLEQTQQLNSKIDALLSTQASLQSVGLIGRTVDITTSGGASATGSVLSLSLSGDTPLISVQTTQGTVLTGISLGQIVAVH